VVRVCSLYVLRSTSGISCAQARLSLIVRGVTEQTTETLTHLEDGWVLWRRGRGGTTEGLTVIAQLYTPREGGPSEIIHVAVIGRKLTADKLRTIPLGHIETLARANPEFSPHPEGPPQHPISEKFDEFSRQEVSRHLMARATAKAYRPEPHKPLSRPNGSDPDAFYREVAEAYRDVVQDHRNVAVVLAEEANVPVGTVHRWIMEARRRGFLPPARKGRAG
jgi:hypothetical protein